MLLIGKKKSQFIKNKENIQNSNLNKTMEIPLWGIQPEETSHPYNSNYVHRNINNTPDCRSSTSSKQEQSHKSTQKLENNSKIHKSHSKPKQKRKLSKTFTSTFKFNYSEEELKANPLFERNLSWKVNIETKHPETYMIGVSKNVYLKDSAVHKRGRSSEQSNKRTFGSQVRYLPGSITDKNDIVVPTACIKISNLLTKIK